MRPTPKNITSRNECNIHTCWSKWNHAEQIPHFNPKCRRVWLSVFILPHLGHYGGFESAGSCSIRVGIPGTYIYSNLYNKVIYSGLDIYTKFKHVYTKFKRVYTKFKRSCTNFRCLLFRTGSGLQVWKPVSILLKLFKIFFQVPTRKQLTEMNKYHTSISKVEKFVCLSSFKSGHSVSIAYEWKGWTP